jgi:hypothetical protein
MMDGSDTPFEDKNWVQLFRLPARGVWEFEYVTWKRHRTPAPIPSGTSADKIQQLALRPRPIEPDKFGQLLDSIIESPLHSKDKLVALRRLSDKLHLTCEQLGELIPYFPEATDRRELLVMLWLQLTDLQNMPGLWMVLPSEDHKQLEIRLGKLVVFPFIQISGRMHDLDLKVHEDRMVLHILANYVKSEGEDFVEHKQDFMET